jgi:formate hydrogenlyase transcriptional activator
MDGSYCGSVENNDGAVTAPQKLQKSIPSLKRRQFTPGTKADRFGRLAEVHGDSHVDFDDGVAPVAHRSDLESRKGEGSSKVKCFMASHVVTISDIRTFEQFKRETSDREIDGFGFKGIVGNSSGLLEVLELIQTVAPTNSTVLVEGETGTGKELIAAAIHARSRRATRPFIKLNCAAIPVGLLESELFGHDLDEIGDLPLEMQAKLLRVLQDGHFERLGSTQTLHSNVRLVAATNGDLWKLISEKRFRSDLYYRLNVFPIHVPPLRDRTEDIPLLVRHFVAKYAARMGKIIDRIPAELVSRLTSHPWPGNIRELENFIECSVILTSGPTLRCPLARLRSAVQIYSSKPSGTLDDVNREHILRTLQQTRGVIMGPNGAAVRLGIKRSTLYARMRKLGISRSNQGSLNTV